MLRRLFCACVMWLGSISTDRAMSSKWWNELDSRLAGWETKYCEEDE